MNAQRFICAAILLVLGVISVLGEGPSEKFVPGEILVKVADDSSRGEDSVRRKGAVVVERFADLGWRRVKLPAGLTVEEAVEKYRNLSGIAAAQPNYYYRLLLTPNDPQFTAAGMYGLTKISAVAAWDLTTGSSAVVVANIDTGARYTHEDLAANMWTNTGEIDGNGIDDDNNGFVDDFYGYDFFFNDGNPIDEHGHGTHTSGTIGAVGNNLIGVVGVNWNVKIMTIKIYDNDGFGTTAAMLINAYNYVRMMKTRGVNIRVTNNSYGGCDEACGYDQATKDAIDALGAVDVLQVFAAGNDGRNVEITPAFPASYTSPSILSVAASGSNDAKAGFSNWGPISVDLAAPGVSILSTTRSLTTPYGTMSGTSMATPHVTGAAALLAAFNPALSAASLKATLMNTVDPLTSWNATPIKTNGRLNVANALQNQTVCDFALSSNNAAIRLKGGYFSINVATQSNCDYSIRSNQNWIHLEGETARSGNAILNFRVSTSPTLLRTGTVTIGGQTLTVTQGRN